MRPLSANITLYQTSFTAGNDSRVVSKQHGCCLSLRVYISTSNSLSANLGTLTGNCTRETNKCGMGWFSSQEAEPLNCRATSAPVSISHTSFYSFIFSFSYTQTAIILLPWLPSRDSSSLPWFLFFILCPSSSPPVSPPHHPYSGGPEGNWSPPPCCAGTLLEHCLLHGQAWLPL